MALDMSFGDGAGWGGDTSFATDNGGRDSESNKLGERLPIPVCVARLSALTDEKVSYGNMVFASAYTIGKVMSVEGDSSAQKYVIADPADESKTMIVFNFGGVEDQNERAPLDVEVGMKLFAAGKIRVVDSVVGILAFRFRKLDTDLEYDCFVKEAEIARLYWEKNVPLALRSDMTVLAGCAAGAPLPRDATAANGGGASQQRAAPTPAASREAHRPAAAAPAARKYGDLRDQLLSILNAQLKRHTADNNIRKDLHVDDLAGMVDKTTEEVKCSLEQLSQDGICFNTVDDFHYELI